MMSSHQPPATRHRVRGWLSKHAIFVALAVECVVLASASEAFFTIDNLSNVMRQNAFTAILAAGMTFVILTAGIDLSVGSVVGLSGMLCADVMARGYGVPGGIAAGMLAELAFGTLNGIIITRVRIPPFVVTLAM